MLVVNLFGAPGAGKSTGAAYIFARLKMAGINAELVTEFAKDKVWEGSQAVFHNQAYLFGEQSFRISRLQDQVEVVVTDSPILLSSFYNDNDDWRDEFDALVSKVSSSYASMNFFLNRVKPYNESGRRHSEEDSDRIADQMAEFLRAHGVCCEYYDGDIDGYEMIIDAVIRSVCEVYHDR